MPNYNLTGQKIKDTYSQLAQVSASALVNGLGVAAPITTASITNFPTEVSRSAAAAGFGQGTGGVSEATFTAYTASNDASVSALTTRVNTMESATGSYAVKTAISGAFTSLSSSLSTRLTNDETSISSLNSATSSYALKTAISGAFTLPSGVVSSSAQINLAQTQGTASWATNSITASYALNSATSAGLINGSGLNSLISSATLTTTPATASGVSGIALGNNAKNYADYSIIIGDGANDSDSSRVNAVVIGRNATSAQNSIALGYGAQCYSDSGIAIGRDSRGSSNDGIAIGYSAAVGVSGGQVRAIAIGYDSNCDGGDSIAIGTLSSAGSYNAIAIGQNASTIYPNEIEIGNGLDPIFQHNWDGNNRVRINRAFFSPVKTLVDDGAGNVPFNTSGSTHYTLNASNNSWTVTNPAGLVAGITYTMTIHSGSNLSWGTSYKWQGGTPPTLSTGSGIDVIQFVCMDGSLMLGIPYTNIK